ANPSSAVGPEINLPLTDLKKFYLSPNPNDGHFELRFQLQGEKTYVILFNQYGQEIERNQYRDSSGLFKKDYDLSKQPKGTYFLSIQQDGKVYSGYIVIQ
ncbi:MAG: T9SS type A sorting domain-containing protein, partial [Haliscomenobacter sp.]|nr:T9SS type A sorting domain-containing protein [Haliscomenobacter sp.]